METLYLNSILPDIEPHKVGKNLTCFGVNIICPRLLFYTPAIERVFSSNLFRVDYFYALLNSDDNAKFDNLIQVYSMICCDIMTRKLQLSSGQSLCCCISKSSNWELI